MVNNLYRLWREKEKVRYLNVIQISYLKFYPIYPKFIFVYKIYDGTRLLFFIIRGAGVLVKRKKENKHLTYKKIKYYRRSEIFIFSLA